MPLPQTHLHDKETSAAVCEVLNNVSWLYMGGYFNEAHEIVHYLTTAEVWRLPEHNALRRWHEKLLHLFSSDTQKWQHCVPQTAIEALQQHYGSDWFLYLDELFTPLILDYLADDRPDLATDLFVKTFARGYSAIIIKYPEYWKWAQIKHYFQAKHLGELLQLNDRDVAEYVDAVKSRSPKKPERKHTVEFDWSTAIRTYKDSPKDPLYIEVYDPFHCEKRSPGLEAIFARGAIVSACGASDAQIADAEQRLGVVLPPSYKAFLKVTNGLLLPDFPYDLLPVEEIEWYRMPEWMCADKHESVCYATPWHKHSGTERAIFERDLAMTLKLSTNAEFQVLLLNPGIRSGEEWEAWQFYYENMQNVTLYEDFKMVMQSLFAEASGEETVQSSVSEPIDRVRIIS